MAKARVTGAKCSTRTNSGAVRRGKACEVTHCTTNKIRVPAHGKKHEYSRCASRTAYSKFAPGRVTVTGPKKSGTSGLSGLAKRRFNRSHPRKANGQFK